MTAASSQRARVLQHARTHAARTRACTAARSGRGHGHLRAVLCACVAFSGPIGGGHAGCVRPRGPSHGSQPVRAHVVSLTPGFCHTTLRFGDQVCIFDDEKTSFVSGHYTSSAFANLQLHEAISKDVYGAGNIMVRGIAWPAQRESLPAADPPWRCSRLVGFACTLASAHPRSYVQRTFVASCMSCSFRNLRGLQESVFVFCAPNKFSEQQLLEEEVRGAAWLLPWSSLCVPAIKGRNHPNLPCATLGTGAARGIRGQRCDC